MNNHIVEELTWLIEDQWTNGNRNFVYAIFQQLSKVEIFLLMCKLTSIDVDITKFNTEKCQQVLMGNEHVPEPDYENARLTLSELFNE